MILRKASCWRVLIRASFSSWMDGPSWGWRLCISSIRAENYPVRIKHHALQWQAWNTYMHLKAHTIKDAHKSVSSWILTSRQLQVNSRWCVHAKTTIQYKLCTVQSNRAQTYASIALCSKMYASIALCSVVCEALFFTHQCTCRHSSGYSGSLHPHSGLWQGLLHSEWQAL